MTAANSPTCAGPTYYEKLATEVFTQWESEEFDYLKSRKLAGAGFTMLAISQMPICAP